MKKMMVSMVIAIGCLFVLMAGNSQASVINGSFWAPATDAYGFTTHDLSTTFFSTLGTANATFSVNSINFNSTPVVTYDTWLQTGGGLAYTTGQAYATGNNIQTSSNSVSYFQFTGTAYFPANFSITHDDGVQLYLGATPTTETARAATNGDSTYPTSPINSTYAITPGTYAFTLDYAAWNGFPEVLQLNNAVPIPAAVWLLGSGLIGLAGIRRRFRR